MKVHEAEAILKYYADIPQRIEIIRRQCTALSDEVDPMRGMGTDGMPRGGTPGDSTAAMACRMDELGIGDQLRQLERQRAVLLEDQNIIRGQMNRLDSGHNLILTEFYISHKKWRRSTAESSIQCAALEVPAKRRSCTAGKEPGTAPGVRRFIIACVKHARGTAPSGCLGGG